jgi:hypothetical protein
MAASHRFPSIPSQAALLLCIFVAGCGSEPDPLNARAGRPSPEQVNALLRQRYATSENLNEQILAVGGRMRLAIDFSYSKLNDDDLAQMEFPDSLSELNLAGTAITDQGITHLRESKNLEKIDLSQTVVTEDCLETLRSLPRLKSANFNYSRVPPEQQLEMVRFFRSRRKPVTPPRP